MSTTDGKVEYRALGRGPTLVLLTGLGSTIDGWTPQFVDALAQAHHVVLMQNAGVGFTSLPTASLSVSEMAEQTAAMIRALGLRRPAILGWSMGGMIAQALAVRYPSLVSRLVLAASQPGDGKDVSASAGVMRALASTNPRVNLSVLFPANQRPAALAYAKAVSAYGTSPGVSATMRSRQAQAVAQWTAGRSVAGHLVSRLRVPTLVGDGQDDVVAPVANARHLAGIIRRSRLAIYPDAGHAFLFQDQSRFVPSVLRFLGS